MTKLTNAGEPHECGKIQAHTSPHSGMRYCIECNWPVDYMLAGGENVESSEVKTDENDAQ